MAYRAGDDEVSLVGLLRSLGIGFVGVLRHNKIAATLAGVALVATTLLAVNSQYDERPRYRQVVLPDIAEAEIQFSNLIQAAEQTNNDNWRIYYFIDAHQKARDILDLVRRRWPHTRDGIRAHEELVRYYELITEDFAIIRTQMSLDDKLDYMAAWRKAQAERRPIHEQWAKWVYGSSPPSPH
jgi:hypothetical protein